MSSLLRERWLRLSGVMTETPNLEPNFEYKGRKVDTGGIEVVSELGFCASVENNGALPTVAQIENGLSYSFLI